MWTGSRAPQSQPPTNGVYLGSACSHCMVLFLSQATPKSREYRVTVCKTTHVQVRTDEYSRSFMKGAGTLTAPGTQQKHTCTTDDSPNLVLGTVTRCGKMMGDLVIQRLWTSTSYQMRSHPVISYIHVGMREHHGMAMCRISAERVKSKSQLRSIFGFRSSAEGHHSLRVFLPGPRALTTDLRHSLEIQGRKWG